MKLVDFLILHKDDMNIAIIQDNQKITYKELYNNSLEKAEVIKKVNTNRNHIAILLPNSIDYIEWYYAILFGDSIVIPIYNNSSRYEIINTIHACDINIIISYKTKYEELLHGGLEYNLTFIDANSSDIRLIKSSGIGPLFNNINEVALMISTSGSLNNPKRVMLTDNNLITNAESIISSLQYQKHDVFLIVLPLCFASANTSQLIVSLILGATIVIYTDILHPRNLAKIINQYQITSLTVVPSIFIKLVNSDYFEFKRSSLQTLCFGGGPTPKQVIEAARGKFKDINLVQMYGQTEASTRLAHMFINATKYDYCSVGKPLEGIKIKIVNEDGEELPIGEVGEISACGNNIMNGYYKQPIETSKVLVNGWLRTGDIGMFNENGLLFICGRKKNIIIYSGLNIYPEEIEDVLLSCTKIEDAIVYGIPDNEFGEVPVADLVLVENTDITEREIIDYCMTYLPSHKIPSEFNIVMQLNKTKNGKKLRKKVEELTNG